LTLNFEGLPGAPRIIWHEEEKEETGNFITVAIDITNHGGGNVNGKNVIAEDV
jgi:hypothetical protein